MSTRDPENSGMRRRNVLALVLVLGVLVAVAVWLLVGDDTSETADRDPETGRSSASVLPTPSIDASGSPLPERSEGQTAPSPVPSGTPQGTIRADITEDVEVVEGVSVRLTGFEAVDGEARGPGETAGPAVRFTVEVTNRTSETLDLLAAVVTATYGRGRTPAGDLSGPRARDLPVEVSAGEVGTGTYVFAIPRGQRGLVRVEFSYGAEAPRVLFAGPVD